MATKINDNKIYSTTTTTGIQQGNIIDNTAANSNRLTTTVPKEDIWTIHGEQYDLREFVKRHPGGSRAINLGRSIDCTELFETYHPFTEKHRKVLQKYKISNNNNEKRLLLKESKTNDKSNMLLSDDGLFDWNHTPFYDDAKLAARKYFSPRGDETDEEIQNNSKATPLAWVQHFVGLALVIPAFYYWCMGSPYAIIYFPLVYWVVCSDLMHNGSHFAQSRIPWINTVSCYMGSFHIQYHLWAIQHVVGHHVHTNIIGYDPDMHHFTQVEEKAAPGYRSHVNHEYLPKYQRFWKFALWFQTGATTVALALLNVPKYLEERKMQTTKIPEAFVNSIKFDRSILVAFIVLFLYNHGLGKGLFTLFWSWSLHGMTFNIFSQISHVNEKCMDDTEKYRLKHNLVKNEWAVHEMLTAVDYSTDSWFWSTASINLNQQICHHLFPSVHPVHYPALRKVLIPICEKHGIDYEGRSNLTFVEAVTQYLKWIFFLNEKVEENEGLKIMSKSNYYLVVLAGAIITLFFTIPVYIFTMGLPGPYDLATVLVLVLGVVVFLLGMIGEGIWLTTLGDKKSILNKFKPKFC
jgi:acyl-lipid (8-3)-desaturase